MYGSCSGNHDTHWRSTFGVPRGAVALEVSLGLRLGALVYFERDPDTDCGANPRITGGLVLGSGLVVQM